MLLEKFIKLVTKARKTPNERAHSNKVLREMVCRLAEATIDQESKARDECGVMQVETFRVPAEDETEEQLAEFQAQLAAKKAEHAKKNKKKPKTEEEEAKEIEEVNAKVTEWLALEMAQNEADRCEQQIEIVKTKWLMDNHIPMDEAVFDQLNRKMSILDIDIGEQDILLRMDLDVPLSHFTQLPPIEEEFKSLFEDQEKSSASRKSTKKKKNKKQIEEEQERQALLEQAKRLRAEPWKSRQILDHTLIKRASQSIKYVQEHLAKRIIILSSLGEKAGRNKPENSMQLLVNPLQHLLPDY